MINQFTDRKITVNSANVYMYIYHSEYDNIPSLILVMLSAGCEFHVRPQQECSHVQLRLERYADIIQVFRHVSWAFTQFATPITCLLLVLQIALLTACKAGVEIYFTKEKPTIQVRGRRARLQDWAIKIFFQITHMATLAFSRTKEESFVC